MDIDLKRHFGAILKEVWDDNSKFEKLTREEVLSLSEQIAAVLQNRQILPGPEQQLRLHIFWGDSLIRLGAHRDVLPVFEKSKALAIHLGDSFTKIKAINGIAVNYIMRGKFREGIEAWKSILAEITLPKQKADMYNNLGIAYAMNDEYQKALEYHYASLKLDEELGLEAEIGTNYVNIANAYWKMRQHEKCLELYQKAVEIFEKQQSQRYLAAAYGNIGNIYTEMGDLHTALEFQLRSLEIKKTYTNEMEIALGVMRLGEIYLKQNNFDKAIKHMQEAYQVFAHTGDHYSTALTNSRLGEAFFQTGNIEQAQHYAQKALQESLTNDHHSILVSAYNLLYRLASSQKDYQTALHYLEQHTEAERKLMGENPKLMVARSEVEYYRKQSEELLENYRLSNIDLLDKNKIISQKSELLDRVNNALQQNLEYLHKLMTVIVHDIRGPIASVSQALKMIKDGCFTEPEIEDLISEMPQSLDKATAIVNDILFWIKNQQPQTKIRLKSVSLCPLLHKTINLYDNMAKLKNLRITAPKECNIFVKSEESLLMVILRNLINNAVKLSPPNSEVTIELREAGRYIYVEISDQGMGLSKERITSLLRKGQDRTTETLSDAIGGFGIALCIDFLSQTKGKLFIRSDEGRGSTFSIRLLKST